MGKLILLAIVLGGGFYGYKTYLYKSEAQAVYEKFSWAMREGKCIELREVVAEESQAKEFVEEYCRPGPGNAAGFASEMAGTPQAAMTKWRSEIKSETATGDEVSLVVVDIPYGPGAMPSPTTVAPSPINATAKLKKVGGALKIREFAFK